MQMPVIDNSYFQNEPLFIPDTVVTPDIQGNNPTSAGKLTAAIAKYERLLLVNALGKDQYDLLIAGTGETSGKWFDLLNGKTYDGKYWPGLKNTDSLIAYFVYYHYLVNDRMQYTTVGLERSRAKNSEAVNPTEKLTEVWNIFIEMYKGISMPGYDLFGYYWPYSYDTVYGFGQYEGDNTACLSLYKFLSDFPDDYDVTFFRDYQVKNRFGL